MKRIITILFLGLVVILFVLVLGITDYKMLSVGSDSMKDYLHKGDIVIIYKEDINNLNENDVIVFHHHNIDIIHRIVKILDEDKRTLYTKGDNNKIEDGWPITEDEYIGKVIFKIRYLGYPSVWISELVKGDLNG